MAQPFCHLLMNFYVANMSLNTIRENKILAKISEFTVVHMTDSIRSLCLK